MSHAAPPETTNNQAILRFFLPLAATSFLMMMSHSFGSSAMAKARDPALALASFSICQSLGQMFEGIAGSSRPLGLAQIKNVQTWQMVCRLVGLVVAALVLIMTVIAFTPLGLVVFSRIMGAPADVAQEAVRVFRFFIIFPAESALRFTYHGLIILRRKTIYTTVAMAGRVSVMFAVSLLMIANPPELGGLAGAAVFLSGVGAEGIVAWLAGRRLIPGLRDHPEDPNSPVLTLERAFTFFIPLGLSGFLSNLSRVLLSAGLSRTIDPKMSLAAYQVAWSLWWMFVGPVGAMHQVTLVFAKSPEGNRKVREFGIKTACLSAVGLLVFAFSGLGSYVLRNWIGVGDQLILPALLMLAVLSLSPFTTLVSELCTGVLLSRSDSASIGGGRTVYVVTLTIAVLAAALVFPQLNALVAPIGMLFGAACESWFLWNRARRPVGIQYPGLLPFGG